MDSTRMYKVEPLVILMLIMQREETRRQLLRHDAVLDSLKDGCKAMS